VRMRERTGDIADLEALRQCPENRSRCSGVGEEVVDWLERDAQYASTREEANARIPTEHR
jgi:hypothetical protein